MTRAVALVTSGGGVTAVGPVRQINQDRFVCDDGLGLYAVFDGVGGHKAGEIAAQLALEAVVGCMSRSATDADDSTWPLGWDPRMSTTSNRLRTAIALANQRVHHAAQANAELEGMARVVSSERTEINSHPVIVVKYGAAAPTGDLDVTEYSFVHGTGLYRLTCAVSRAKRVSTLRSATLRRSRSSSVPDPDGAPEA